MISKTYHIGLKEFRTKMEEIIKAVERGDCFIVFRRLKPIFMVTPVDKETMEQFAEFKNKKLVVKTKKQ